jgi:coenzyme F420-0:L-glutamate ligase/coenzyme F420-1:gamma-L-glutamate ligase
LTLTLTPIYGIPNINPEDDLVGLIHAGLMRQAILLEHGDILVIAQKIVSKAEGRAVNLSSVEPSQEAYDLAQIIAKDPRLTELILQESNTVLRTKPGTIIVEHRLGFVCANAGIDHSNVGSFHESDEWVLLLPEDPDASARILREGLEEISGVSIGVLIIDSHGRAWRMGTAGVAIGFSGMPGLVDLRGKADLFGYKLEITQVGAADELASAASLVMGQASEGNPVVHTRGFPYDLREGQLNELIRPKQEDLFR